MSPYPRAPYVAPPAAPQLQLLPGGRCFFALPPNLTAVDCAWLELVARDLLERHERVLFLLATDLGSYDRGADPDATRPLLDPAATTERLDTETLRRWRDIEAIRLTLPPAVRHRVQIATWSHFIDPSFVSVWRHLLTAFGVGTDFRRDVLLLGRQHRRDLRAARGPLAPAPSARAACLRAIETLAMRLRIGELAGYHHEYGYGRDSVLAERLYAGAYAADGLTVESLMGDVPQRHYRRLD